MIDTIVLTLPKDMFYIFEPDRFNPSARWVMDDTGYSGSRGFIVSKQNPTPEELKNGIYKPRLSVTRRFNHTQNIERTLKIELSLPKLIYNNNFDELTEKDFDYIVDKLQTALKSMGVDIFSNLLKIAPVSAIHYSKNIPLTDGTLPFYYLKRMQEANISDILDINSTDYRVGHCVKYHTNSYEVVFYDKIEDLKKGATISNKRIIDNDNAIQIGLFNTLKQRKFFEVLRMEIRLNKRFKIKSLFNTLNIKTDLTFQSLFNEDISKKVLLHYLDFIEDRRPKILDYKTKTAFDFACDVVLSNPHISSKKALEIVGFKQISDIVSMREMKKIFSKQNSYSWNRIVKEIKKINLPKRNSPFWLIRKEIEQFKPLKLVDFESKIYNNYN
ncbi:hypothetical protein COY87_00020 [Candidatus Roizmanbacteria bacterium CG_4_10_14_0_8_um_filter_33_9]|uniref:Uncharacterized protein n=1 Tax=Candidatus Roizmanbacteria bacterium CG_4_10_14_0_8_um_filter_33_9 TaxID=1974826 RepID=A0A2M7QJV6_9BACT|nr:MAG: hypothetical protein COY87_00020 [Candidatus Roizmanbacteria bacterium CG_4_10_14_0_8_um_filter_33_9]